MSTRPAPHRYLPDGGRHAADVLLRRATRHLNPDEQSLLLRLWEHLQRDLQHAKTSAAGLRRDINKRHEQARTAQADADQHQARIALAAAILNGWGPAGDEADRMRHEIRAALNLREMSRD